MRKLRHLWLLNLRVLRFWLSLLVLGFAFWTIGQLMTLRILGRTYQTSHYFITDVQPEDIAQRSIAAIKVEICNESGASEAKIISDEPSLRSRKLRFSLTAPEDIEQAIAKELDMPLQEVNSLAYHKVHNHYCGFRNYSGQNFRNSH
ncbi:MAG: hypothetical protein MJA27_15325 [Pseudanabaenales cyanobacterium]|nr:hypothetical protein [Pseudanabaenales cyanobacterium]